MLPSKRVAQVAAALLLAAALSGCSSVVDNIPSSMGGLPEGTPQRPATPTAFPSVHDMPPARQDSALSEAESKRLREDLKNTRIKVAPPEATDTTPAAATAGSARNP
jgi:PBP1b-binding outer membrane lipoprotein LpoB